MPDGLRKVVIPFEQKPMTIEKFYETLQFISQLDRRLGLQDTLEAIRSTLVNLVNSPSQPQHQSALAASLAQLTTSAAEITKSLTPTISSAIAELGGEEFFDASIAESVKASISANAMTPTVAREFVQDLSSRRGTFLATVRQTLEGLHELNVTSSTLQPGHADLAFLIPRDLFKNQVGPLAKELNFISRLVGDFSEAVTGELQPAELQQLSSSIPTVAIAAGVGTVAAIATVVNKFLEAWEKIEKIRKIRAELNEMGIKGKLVEELTTQITTTVTEVIEESTVTTLREYKGESGRRNELESAIKQDTHRLFGQIERGLTIQFRATPKEDADATEQASLKEVDRASHEMQFPRIQFEPMLLSSGEVLEGDLLKDATVVSRKSATQKTTTKRETRKSGKTEDEA